MELNLDPNTRDRYISYIYNYINDLPYKNRIEVTQMIIYSGINKNKIIEKMDGIYIKCSLIGDALWSQIYNFVKNKIEHDNIEFI